MELRNHHKIGLAFCVMLLRPLSHKLMTFQVSPFPNHFRVDKYLSIKIADFGLAKDVYCTEYYRIDKHTTLPIKWMSLESSLDGYFDEKTDVVCTYVRKKIFMFTFMYVRQLIGLVPMQVEIHA